jgi:hypothetical protein
MKSSLIRRGPKPPDKGVGISRNKIVDIKFSAHDAFLEEFPQVRSILKNWNAKNFKGFGSWLITCISQYGAH